MWNAGWFTATFNQTLREMLVDLPPLSTKHYVKCLLIYCHFQSNTNYNACWFIATFNQTLTTMLVDSPPLSIKHYVKCLLIYRHFQSNTKYNCLLIYRHFQSDHQATAWFPGSWTCPHQSTETTCCICHNTRQMWNHSFQQLN